MTEFIQSFLHGGVAQLGEHLPCKQGVRSSILLISTIRETRSKKLSFEKLEENIGKENLFFCPKNSAFKTMHLENWTTKKVVKKKME